MSAKKLICPATGVEMTPTEGRFGTCPACLSEHTGRWADGEPRPQAALTPLAQPTVAARPPAKAPKPTAPVPEPPGNGHRNRKEAVRVLKAQQNRRETELQTETDDYPLTDAGNAEFFCRALQRQNMLHSRQTLLVVVATADMGTR